MKTLALSIALAACVISCGGTDGGGGINSGVFSCDFTTNGTHGFGEYTWSGGAYSSAAWASACTQQKGTAGTGCTRTGAVGGCKVTTTNAGITITTTTWFYSGTAADVKTACGFQNGTFVSP